MVARWRPPRRAGGRDNHVGPSREGLAWLGLGCGLLFRAGMKRAHREPGRHTPMCITNQIKSAACCARPRPHAIPPAPFPPVSEWLTGPLQNPLNPLLVLRFGQELITQSGSIRVPPPHPPSVPLASGTNNGAPSRTLRWLGSSLSHRCSTHTASRNLDWSGTSTGLCNNKSSFCDAQTASR